MREREREEEAETDRHRDKEIETERQRDRECLLASTDLKLLCNQGWSWISKPPAFQPMFYYYC